MQIYHFQRHQPMDGMGLCGEKATARAAPRLHLPPPPQPSFLRQPTAVVVAAAAAAACRSGT
jgi:hypothetical protein